MVRFVQEMKIVEREGLVQAANVKGDRLAGRLRELEARIPGMISNVRGLGLYQGFSLPTPELRNRLEEMALGDEGLLLLPAGTNSIRTRPNLSVTEPEIDLFIEMLERCLRRLAA
jgi:L-lysine 6-transaminase